MSVQWTYIPNDKREGFWCPHCCETQHSPYFTSAPGLRSDTYRVCLRCAKVLSRCYATATATSSPPHEYQEFDALKAEPVETVEREGW